MTISHEKKLIFIHIPKNAGTSIIKAMECVHNFYIDKTLPEYKEHYKEYWNTYNKFAVIRDPIDRFISAYKFARMKESGWFSATGEENLEKHHHYDICNSMNINEYVDYIFNHPKELNRWIVPQSWIISDEDNQIEIDTFIRYENLLEDLQKIKIDNIQKLNTSKIEDESLIQLTKKSKILLSQIYNIDYINFHYQKPVSSLSYQYK
jgi:hypothetical protein